VFSAGATPTRVNPFAIKVMAELGIDISDHRSKSIEKFRNHDIDLVVAVCSRNAKVACPFCSSSLIGERPKIIDEKLTGAKQYLHHPFRDPSEIEGNDEEKLKAFQQVRDEIQKWILEYFHD
jgi:arsenate reductase